MPLTRRSQGRILALQALCAFDALGVPSDGDLEAFLHDRVNHADLGWQRPPKASVIEFARTLARGVWDNQARGDKLLQDNVPGWSLKRMQPVDRSILRLGLYELLETPDTPHQVVMNEAIELARQFGGAESPAFVNGVLDGLWRELASRASAGESTPSSSSEGAPPGDDA